MQQRMSGELRSLSAAPQRERPLCVPPHMRRHCALGRKAGSLRLDGGDAELRREFANLTSAVIVIGSAKRRDGWPGPRAEPQEQPGCGETTMIVDYKARGRARTTSSMAGTCGALLLLPRIDGSSHRRATIESNPRVSRARLKIERREWEF